MDVESLIEVNVVNPVSQLHVVQKIVGKSLPKKKNGISGRK